MSTPQREPIDPAVFGVPAHVRAEIVPAAESVNPAFRDALERTMNLLADDDALLGGMADAFARDFAAIEPGREVAFNREWMRTLDRTMARRTVRNALSSAFDDSGRLEAEHVEALVTGFVVDGFARDLPFGLRAFTEYDKMIVSRTDVMAAAVAPTLLPIPGTADLGPAGLLTAEIAEDSAIDDDACSVVVDIGNAAELTVGAPGPGDRMRPFGMEGTRKLSDLLIDAKVPARRRSATPVVRDGETVLWLAGVRLSEEARVTQYTRRRVRLRWQRPSSAGGDGCDRECSE